MTSTLVQALVYISDAARAKAYEQIVNTAFVADDSATLGNLYTTAVSKAVASQQERLMGCSCAISLHSCKSCGKGVHNLCCQEILKLQEGHFYCSLPEAGCASATTATNGNVSVSTATAAVVQHKRHTRLATGSIIPVDTAAEQWTAAELADARDA